MSDDSSDPMPAPDLSRLAEWEGYLAAMGDENAIAFWKEIRRSIYRPIEEWAARHG